MKKSSRDTITLVTHLSLSSKNPISVRTDALVVATAKTSDGVALLTDQFPRDLVTELETLAPYLNITGATNEVRKIPAGPRMGAHILVFTGLGERASDGTFSTEKLRSAAGAATRELSGVKSAALALPTADNDALAAIAEGALLGAYSFNAYRTGEEDDSKAPVESLEVLTMLSRGKAAQRAVRRAHIVSDAVHVARDMVNTPPNDMYPAAFAEAAVRAVKGVKGLKVTVLDEKALASGGFGGLTAVGAGSSRGPRLVKMTYTPPKATHKVALVGKGITFDTGGISLKPSTLMTTMKLDMAGAAAAFQTVLAAARLELPCAVTAYLCLAENMPSGSAQRPSDVITVYGGKTVEVLNTDAEGRVVMADGLSLAVQDGHDVVVDIATLTGAQMIALGLRTSAVMGTESVRDELVQAANITGESLWPMPLPAHLQGNVASKIADVANHGPREAGMLNAGMFLKTFVGDTPWAHVDIAGPAFNSQSPHGYTPRGGTGVGVRMLLGFLEGRAYVTETK